MAFYKHLFDEWPVSYTCHRILYNNNSQPYDSVFVDVNKAFENFIGQERNRLLWRKASEVFQQAQISDLNWTNFLQKAVAYNKEFNYLFVWRGNYYEIKACCPEEGFVAVCIEIARGLITDEKTAQSSELVLSALDGADGIIMVINPENGEIIYINPCGQAVFPFSIGASCPETFAPRLGTGELFNSKQHNLQQIGIQGARFHQSPDDKKSFLFLDYLLQWSGGQTVYIQAGTDMTQLRKAAVEAQNNEQRLRVTLQCVGEGIVTINEQGRIEMLNEAAEQMTGWTQAEAAGLDIAEILHLTDSNGQKLKDPIKAIQAAGADISTGCEMEMTSRNGFKRNIIGTFSFIVSSSNAPIGSVLVFRDATSLGTKEKIPYSGAHRSIAHLEENEYKTTLENLQSAENLPCALIIGHLNGFKMISDAFGFSMGEKFIKSAEQSIDKLLRPDDIITKWDGDEFAILLPHTSSVEARDIGVKIKEEISRINLNALKNCISIGYETQADFSESLYDMIERTSEYMYKQNLIENALEKNNTVNAMMHTLNEKSPREALHSQHVSEMCKTIGKALELPQEEIYQLGIAGLLHDIGKTVIDAIILNKPDKLSDEEWQEMKRHPEIGYRILSSSGGMDKIAPYVLAHHERYDGQGYPNGLAGEDIPIQARVLTLADSYDAMTMDRSYRKGLSKKQAAEEIGKNSGTQFDPAIAEMFLTKVLPDLP